MSPRGAAFKQCFLIKTGDKFTYIDTKDIAYFMADGNIIYAVTRENKKYIIGFSLEELVKTLNPGEFIRVKRKYLLHISSIRKVSKYFNSHLKVEINPAPADDEILVSHIKAKIFLDRFEGTLT